MVLSYHLALLGVITHFCNVIFLATVIVFLHYFKNGICIVNDFDFHFYNRDSLQSAGQCHGFQVQFHQACTVH